jgi:hypothetical protein
LLSRQKSFRLIITRLKWGVKKSTLCHGIKLLKIIKIKEGGNLMFRKRYLFIFLTLAIFTSLLLFGCVTDQATGEPEPDVEGQAEEQVDIIRLGGGDWGYPTPYAHYPRGPGSRKMRLIFDTLLTSDGEGNNAPMLQRPVWIDVLYCFYYIFTFFCFLGNRKYVNGSFRGISKWE